MTKYKIPVPLSLTSLSIDGYTFNLSAGIAPGQVLGYNGSALVATDGGTGVGSASYNTSGFYIPLTDFQKLYCSTHGDDILGSGSIGNPYASPERALLDIDLFNRKKRTVIYIAAGSYNIGTTDDGLATKVGLRLPQMTSSGTTIISDHNVLISGASYGDVTFEGELIVDDSLVDAYVVITARPDSQLAYIQDTSKSWTVNQHKGKILVDDQGISGRIQSNTSNTLVVCQVSINFSGTGMYILHEGVTLLMQDASSFESCITFTAGPAWYFRGIILAGATSSNLNSQIKDIAGASVIMEMCDFAGFQSSSRIAFSQCWSCYIHPQDNAARSYALYGTNIQQRYSWSYIWGVNHLTGYFAPAAPIFDSCFIEQTGHPIGESVGDITGVGIVILNCDLKNTEIHVAGTGGMSTIEQVHIDGASAVSRGAGVQLSRGAVATVRAIGGSVITGIGMRALGRSQIAISDWCTVTGSLGDLIVGNKSTRTWNSFQNNAPIAVEADPGSDGSVIYNLFEVSPNYTIPSVPHIVVDGYTISCSNGAVPGMILQYDGNKFMPATISTGAGTVTSIATDSTLTGGTITNSGTLGINLSHSNLWTADQTFTHNVLIDGYLQVDGYTIDLSHGAVSGMVLQYDGSHFIPTTHTTVSNSDGTLTISPITNAVIASLNLNHANIWSGSQTFTGGVFSTAGSIDFSNSNGVFKTTTGASSFIGSSNTFTNNVIVDGYIDAGNGININSGGLQILGSKANAVIDGYVDIGNGLTVNGYLQLDGYKLNLSAGAKINQVLQYDGYNFIAAGETLAQAYIAGGGSAGLYNQLGDAGHGMSDPIALIGQHTGADFVITVADESLTNIDLIDIGIDAAGAGLMIVKDLDGMPVFSTVGGFMTFSKAVIKTPVSLSVVTQHIVLNANLGNKFTVVLDAGADVLNNFTNRTDGQEVILSVKQDPELGNATLSYGNLFRFPGGTHPTITAAAGATDILYFECLDGVIYLIRIAQDMKS